MLGHQQQQHYAERRSGSRRRRRGRSGEGIVKANRKTEICLHWRNGSCPYGAGSCAFAHGLGELRHATMDDETIVDSVSEDSGSCPPSPRDSSPSHGARQHSRDRRLPTFVHLSAGNTPELMSGSGSSSTAATSHSTAPHRGRQRERSNPWPANDDVRRRSALIEVPIPARISTPGTEFSASRWGLPGSESSVSSAGMPASEMFNAAYGRRVGDGHRSNSSASSSTMPSPFGQPLMIHGSQKQHQTGRGETHAGGARVGPTPQQQGAFPRQGAGTSVWW